jgi:CRP-like cAMP-binding protein
MRLLGDKTFLQLLPDDAVAALGQMKSVQLLAGERVEQAGSPVDAIYFPQDCLIAMISNAGRADGIAAALIGHEGMTGTGLIAGDRIAAFDMVVQTSGWAWKAATATLVAALESSPGFRSVLLRYARTLTVQIATAAAVNASASAERRLARCILMMADRVGDRILVTHKGLGRMVALRRAGITVALGQLEDEGLVKVSRGAIALAHRDGLEKFAGASYGLAEREYARLLARSGFRERIGRD